MVCIPSRSGYASTGPSSRTCTARLSGVEQQLWTPQKGSSYMVRPKRGSVGTIPVGDAVVTGMARYFEEFPPSTPILCVSGQEEILVFSDEKGNPIRRQRWNEVWNRAAKTAGLPPGTTPHDVRHFYASLLSRGASVKAVPDDAPPQDGHRDPHHLRPPMAGGQRPRPPSRRRRTQPDRQRRGDEGS